MTVERILLEGIIRGAAAGLYLSSVLVLLRLRSPSARAAGALAYVSKTAHVIAQFPPAIFALGLTAWLGGCATVAPPDAFEPAPTAVACPTPMPAGTRCLRGQDSIARLGGDEFAILLTDIADASDVMRAVNRINDQFKLTAGLRYTQDKQDYAGCSRDVNGVYRDRAAVLSVSRSSSRRTVI